MAAGSDRLGRQAACGRCQPPDRAERREPDHYTAEELMLCMALRTRPMPSLVTCSIEHWANSLKAAGTLSIHHLDIIQQGVREGFTSTGRCHSPACCR